MNGKKNRNDVPSAIKPWIYHRGSLTKLLQSKCKHSLSVRMLKQHYSRPSLIEQEKLGIRNSSQVWVREVLIGCDKNSQVVDSWVYARVAIPIRFIARQGKYIKRFKQKSIGPSLFERNKSHRTLVDFHNLKHNRVVYNRMLEIAAQNLLDEGIHFDKDIWLRQSLISQRDSNRIFLTEAFLRSFPFY